METKMEIIPLHDRVLLRPATVSSTASGVFVPPSATERSPIMTVVAVGDGRMEDGTQTQFFVEPGDTVLVSKYAGVEVTATGEKLFLLKQCDILAKAGERK